MYKKKIHKKICPHSTYFLFFLAEPLSFLPLTFETFFLAGLFLGDFLLGDFLLELVFLELDFLGDFFFPTGDVVFTFFFFSPSGSGACLPFCLMKTYLSSLDLVAENA